MHLNSMEKRTTMPKAKIDKDTNDYLSPNSMPASERETAYKNQGEVEGNSKPIADRNGNGDDVFKGSTKPAQGRRKGDQITTGAAGSMDEHVELTELTKSLLLKYKMKATKFKADHIDDADRRPLINRENGRNLASKKIVGISMHEAGGSDTGGADVATASSDNPSMGLGSVNASDFSKAAANTKSLLEGIALQAAEAFEILQENSNIPESISSELKNCSDVVTKLYDYLVQSSSEQPENDNGSAGLPPEQPTGPSMKEDIQSRIESKLAKSRLIEAAVAVFNKISVGGE